MLQGLLFCTHTIYVPCGFLVVLWKSREVFLGRVVYTLIHFIYPTFIRSSGPSDPRVPVVPLTGGRLPPAAGTLS